MSEGLPTTLRVVKRCYVGHGLLPARGHIILTPRFICFWRRAVVGQDIKVRWRIVLRSSQYRFHCKDIKKAVIAPGIRTAFHGMALQLHGRHDLRFEFWRAASRDEASLQFLTSADTRS